MSIIAVEILEDKIQVGADSRIMSGDRIICDDFVKIKQISSSLIIGITGLSDILGIFEKFVATNKTVFEQLNNTTDAVPLFKRFKDYIIDNYGYNEQTIKEFGGFLVVNKQYHTVFYYDDNLTPYSHCEFDTKFAFGSTREYTQALLDCGIPIKEAIEMTAKKYTAINDNVTILEINKNE